MQAERERERERERETERQRDRDSHRAINTDITLHPIKEYPSIKDHKREQHSDVYQHYLRRGGISQCVCQTKGIVI